jgi:hypothetical protein
LAELSTEASLSAFVSWVRLHLRGDEKGESQLFLDRLFQAFGHEGVREAGATLETRVRQGKPRATTFADLVWKPRVLVEMKRRGEQLQKHYQQAFDYWVHLVPNRPRYVVLCNFDEFWIYDFENQIDVPVDMVTLDQLPQRYGPLAFLFPLEEKPHFGNDHQAVTRDAAAHLASCFNQLTSRGVSRRDAQKFILQLLVALFAEDIGLLPRYLVASLLDECQRPQDSYDLLGSLFVAMNTPGEVPAGRFKGVQYFNGGLFAEPARIELVGAELDRLRAAAMADWSKVRPEIFGTLFERSLDKEDRHAYGAHFTSPVDILQIVRPTIVEPWHQAIEAATSTEQLRALADRLRAFTVLDPACGSGNFLYIAFREMKRLEARLVERITENSHLGEAQLTTGVLTSRNFFGLDVNVFAVELAKVTMMLARKLAIDEFHSSDNALPLDNLDSNFACRDALLNDRGEPAMWPSADAIIGNPPFLGAKLLKPERGDAYVKALRSAYPDVPSMADYCVYWFRKAHELLPPLTSEHPFRGRAGLVVTQNIRNNASRRGGLDFIAATGTIVDAVDNQPWPGEANVHVSIVNWVRTQDPSLLPAQRRLWHVLPKRVLPKNDSRKRRNSGASSTKQYDLSMELVGSINSALASGVIVSTAKLLGSNVSPQVAFQGVVTGYDGFVISLDQRAQFIMDQLDNDRVTKPYLIGRDLVGGDGKPSRAVIDFGEMDKLQAMHFEGPWKHVQSHVMPAVLLAAEVAKGSDMGPARTAHLQRWWQFWNVRQGMRAAFSGLGRYLACSRVTKRPVFCFVDSTIVPDTALQTFALADDYSFGVLQSASHWQWFVANCSKLKADFRYTATSVFQTFPFPQSPSSAAVLEVAAAARHVRAVRKSALSGVKGGLRTIYRSLESPGKSALSDAHAHLDSAVVQAYGFATDSDMLEQLLSLNRDVAVAADRGEPVERPGPPSLFDDPERLVSQDCIVV